MERLLSAVQASGLGVHDYDVVSGLIRWDARVKELWCVDQEPLTFELFLSRIHPDDRSIMQAAFDRALEPSGSGAYAAEYRVVDPSSGGVRWVADTGQVSFAAGVATRLVGTVQDISAAKAAQAALLASDERLRLATDAAGLAIWIWHAVGDEVTWENDRAQHLLGILRDERPMPGASFLREFFHPQDAPRFAAAIAQTLSNAAPLHFLGRCIRRDGVERWIEFTARAHRLADGSASSLIGTAADVTERQRAEEQVKRAAEANAKFRTMFKQGAQFAGILSLDGTVVEANHLSVEACGFSQEQVIGKPFWQCGWWNRSPRLVELVRNATLSAAQGRFFRGETLYFHADGSERFVDLVIAPVTDDEGRVLFVAPTGTDITDRKHVEQRLRLLDTLGQATRSAAAPEAVMEISTRLLGEHLQATRCAYADVEADNDRFTIRHDFAVVGAVSTVGQYSLDRFGPETTAALRVGRTLVVRNVAAELTPSTGGDMFSAIGIQAIICCPLVKEGRLVAMMAVHQATPRDWSAEEIGLVEEVVDRSWAHIERARASDELCAQDRRKDEFLATLAHELRNPLAPIRTGLEVLKLTPTGSDAVKARDTMDRQLAHLVRLVDDLLDVSRIRSGKFELKPEPIQLRAVIEHAVEATRPLIAAAGHELVIRLPPEPVWIKGDLTRLAQVVSNLLNNSVKYTPNGGQIEISAQAIIGHAVLEVRDNGSGVSAEMLPEVFNLFAQVNRTLARAQGGLGIGLSLSRNLIEMHGGTLEARSPGIGQGSTFTLRLPRIEAVAAQVRSSAAGEVAKNDGSARALRVLVVDDNEDGADLLATMLGMMGHEPRIAYRGEEALELAAQFRPHVVFLDIGLPDIDGYEVARRLRADPRLADIRLAALTGWGSQEDKRRAHLAGFDHHFTKPVDAATVRELLLEDARARSASPGSPGAAHATLHHAG